jgi:hypothetical protein
MGPFRTTTTPVNVRDLAKFDAGTEVTPELLKQAGVVRTLKHPIKILGSGELSTKLTVHAHGFSARAVELIEGAGGTVVRLGGEPEEAPKPARRKRAAAPAEETDAAEAAEPSAAEEAAAEAVAEADEEPAAEAAEDEAPAEDAAEDEE